MNSICLMGRLTADPELKTTQSGVSVCSFTLAVDRGYASKGGERQADFIPCVAWRQTAEFITRYFRKGQRMAVNGTLQTRKYTDREGETRTAYEVTVDAAFFCESKKTTDTVTEEIPLPESSEPIMQHAEAFMDVTYDEELPI